MEINVKNIVEAALLASGRPMTVDFIQGLFSEGERPEKDEIRQVLAALESDYENRGIELKRVASGYRIQVRTSLSEWISRLWQERPPRYSRALLETLAIIAYRQPITRGEIEEIRGVSVSTNIMRTLLDRGWVRVVGHRDVPGKPAIFATAREFLDYFGLKSLQELPPLAEIRDLDSLNVELDLGESGEAAIIEPIGPAEDMHLEEATQELLEEISQQVSRDDAGPVTGDKPESLESPESAGSPDLSVVRTAPSGSDE